MKENVRIVTLGGGIGAANLIRGLKRHTRNITAVVSMADDGGSAGRLRRLYNIHPSGDIIACMAAFAEDPLYEKILNYRFPGDRYAKDYHLAGHKLGNLMAVAARDITGDYAEGLKLLQKLFRIAEDIYPATAEQVSIWAKTQEGKEVHGEENIDMGKYDGEKMIERVYLTPETPKAVPEVITAMNEADIIIAGPGDLYTAILPVLIVPEIKEALIQSSAEKIFVVNVANKPFETKGYHVTDYITALKKHMGTLPFTTIITNNTVGLKIPHKYRHYSFVVPERLGEVCPEETCTQKEADVVKESFPLYHDPEKLAKVILNEV